MKPRLRDGVFALLWALLTLGVGLCGLPCLLSRRASCWVGMWWARASLWLLRKVCGISSQVQGYNNILPGPAIYAAKHQSTWDTLMLFSVLERPAFVLKRSLYAIPVFGWYLWRSGQIAIDRKAGARALEQMIAQARVYAAQGRPIVIFPEGTRQPPFAPPRYKHGVVYVSEATQLPVVPVALNAGKVWPRTPLAKRSGTAILAFLPPMPPARKGSDPWLDDLQGRIETATSALLRHV